MFNNFQNNAYMNPGYPQPGMQYAQRPMAKMTQTLTPEQIKKLKSNGGTFDLQVSQPEMWKAICTHKENGNIVLVENGDGTVTCPICGAKFSIIASDNEQVVEDAAKLTYDVLQTIKTMYLDIPEDMATQYFQILPLLERMPKLYNIAMNNFSKYDNQNQFQTSGSMYGFNALNAITNPVYGGMGMGMQAPAMPQPNMYQPQPQMMQQPMFQQPGMPVQNPFGYGYPQAPVQAPMMPTAEAPATPEAPQADANAAPAVTTQKTFNV